MSADEMPLPGLVIANQQPRARRRDHNWRFLRQWVKHPMRTAAMLPSSPALARLLVSEICANSGPVVELGPGTGAVTEALLDTGIAPEAVTLLELNPEFAALLHEQYPQIRVLQGNAKDLDKYLPPASIASVISSLPMLSLPQGEVRKILLAAVKVLRPDGALYQFSYSRICPLSKPLLEDLGLSVTCIGGTLRNLPPAWVFKINRIPLN